MTFFCQSCGQALQGTIPDLSPTNRRCPTCLRADEERLTVMPRGVALELRPHGEQILVRARTGRLLSGAPRVIQEHPRTALGLVLAAALCSAGLGVWGLTALLGFLGVLLGVDVGLGDHTSLVEFGSEEIVVMRDRRLVPLSELRRFAARRRVVDAEGPQGIVWHVVAELQADQSDVLIVLLHSENQARSLADRLNAILAHIRTTVAQLSVRLR